MSQLSFRRPFVAKQFCDALEGKGLLDARSGLFLTARRRVGKTTFLHKDLIPEILARGWLPVYVDLWKERTADAAILIGDAIKRALAEQDGLVAKTARGNPTIKAPVMGALNMDLAIPGLPAGVTIADAAAALGAKAKRPIVLIVDEAQYALATEAGESAMFGIKSARDSMNRSYGVPQLMLVMTGSNRARLAHLVLNRAQPFFGSRVTPFPLLGREFTDAFTERTNKYLAKGNQLKPDDVFAAFELVGNRPDILRSIVSNVAMQGKAPKLSALLHLGAEGWREEIWGEYEQAYASLNSLQKAVLGVMVEKLGAAFSPFSEDSMKAYRTAAGGNDIQPSTVQYALDALRDRELVWREARGSYALEDDGFADWYSKRVAKT